VDFKPHIALILNVTPDHLNRYKSLEDYFITKLNIGKNQESIDYLILNYDDPMLLRENIEIVGKAKRVWFSRLECDFETGAYLKDDHIYTKLGDKEEKVSLIKNPLKGLHNLENLLASVTTARLMGISSSGIEKSMEDFKGLPHRMESVGKLGNVEFINDSKATNVDATLKSINSMNQSTVLILGGKDKGSDFAILLDPIRQKAEHVLLIGDAASTIHLQLRGIAEKISIVSDFSEAVEKGYRLLAKKGGVVLLAPGCASFDMFENFEHRGQVFKEEVLKLNRKQKVSTNG
jgi:UDP-N-acetylmuramoylalanine--D-glutamate ligase